MVKIFFASHGKLASGMKGSLDVLLGNSSNITVFDAFVDEQIVQNAIEDFYSQLNDDDTVVLCSDLYGGSVNQAMFLYLQNRNDFLVAGINLPFLLELAMRDSITKDELLEMINDGRQALCFVEPPEVDDFPQDDFF